MSKLVHRRALLYHVLIVSRSDEIYRAADHTPLRPRLAPEPELRPGSPPAPGRARAHGSGRRERAPVHLRQSLYLCYDALCFRPLTPHMYPSTGCRGPARVSAQLRRARDELHAPRRGALAGGRVAQTEPVDARCGARRVIKEVSRGEEGCAFHCRKYCYASTVVI